jgi:hypothetical protein
LLGSFRIHSSARASYAIPNECPFRVGLPFPKGTSARELESIQISTASGQIQHTDLNPTAFWSDGSVRWASVDLLVDLSNSSSFYLGTKDQPSSGPEPRCISSPMEPRFDRDQMKVLFRKLNTDPLDGELCISLEVSGSWGTSTLQFSPAMGSKDQPNKLFVEFCAFANVVTEALALPIEFQLSGKCWCTGQIDFSLRVRNPNPAEHPGGNWDLGNQGSFYLSDLSLKLLIENSTGSTQYFVRETPSSTVRTGFKSIELFQASSGGSNWNSSNHIDRHRNIPLSFQGFRLCVDKSETYSDRATPYVAIECEGTTLGVACTRFWENFPMAIRASGGCIEIGLLPKESEHEHEIQGGEQKTYRFAAYIGQSPANSFPLDGYLSDPYAVIDLEYLRSCGELTHIARNVLEDQAGELYEQLVSQAIVGSNSFFAKREKIDEFGWRNYGDLYGDHEAVFHRGTSPMISHQNNQYDCTLGFFYQFIRSGDPRWYHQMIAMADHSWDIDTYHTDHDKLLYNGGLFWHTYHYADADTGTHRSYPKSLLHKNHFESGRDLSGMGKTGEKLEKVYGKGGGPAASHNYSTGWMYVYFLTGDVRYKEAAINAANYVIKIEDGMKTPFRWLSRQPTGYATCSSHEYYGPGRASANSTLALLTGYELSNDIKYLKMAVSLMRRTVHPQQDLDQLDLLNAELRWFYTMYLQALCRLIEILRESGGFEEDFFYAVASLMHYARWMTKNERPTLETPERLQYPTETWAAQDMRKWHVLAYSAKWASSDHEQAVLLDRAEFFFQYSVTALDSFPTKSLTRPVVLMLNYGWQRYGLRMESRIGDPVPKSFRFEKYQEFVPQRQIAVTRAKRILFVAVLVFLALLLIGIVGLLR